MRIVIAIVIVLASCSSPVVGYMKAKNPGCDVEVLSKNGSKTELLIRCPGEDPRYQVVTER